MSEKDIIFFLVFLIIVLAYLAWSQNEHFGPISNQGSLTRDNLVNLNTLPAVSLSNANGRLSPSNIMNSVRKPDPIDKQQSSLQKTNEIVDKILKSNIQPTIIPTNMPTNMPTNNPYMTSNDNVSNNTEYTNPIIEDVNNERDYIDDDQQALDELMKEVNTGNDLIVNSPERDIYKSRSRSINSADKYRKVSYKDSKYRYDFNDQEKPDTDSQDELNGLYNESLIFKNSEFSTNDNFKVFNETSANYGNANLKDFSSGKQTAKEKVMSLYNSDSYLPNNNLLDSKLTKGFQILDNPVAVSNSNLIPVLKSIPVSSISGSTRNSTYDIRSEPPCPKTVVSPFLNSTIMPDIYATNRGCL